MAAENGRVHPSCVNSSNPYHECGMACLEKVSQGQGHKDIQRKKLGSWSFGRKSKGSDSQPDSPRAPRTPRVVDKVAVGGQKADSQHARSEYYPKKKVGSENGKSFTSEHFSREIHPEDYSSNKEKVRSTQAVPPTENVKMNDGSKEPPKESVTSPTSASPSNNNDWSKGPPKESVTSPTSASPSNNNDWSKGPPKESVTSPTSASPSNSGKDDKIQASHHDEIYQSTEDVGEYIPSPIDRSGNFSFSEVYHITPRDSDDEAQSVISDCVSVGKYHVRASISSILQSIINKYGDIAANCKLESNSMRAYYLECLCSVVQELQSTSLSQMTKPKVKEMLAVLKDVGSVQIDVSWLRDILNEISEAIDLSPQHETINAAKANLESTRKELESQMQELALKEKEVADLKEHVAETKSCLSKLEFESNQLEQIIQAAQFKVKKFSSKSLADEIL